MCHFVTATMSAGGDVDAVRKIAKSFVLRWQELRNPSVEDLRELEEDVLYEFTQDR